MAALAAIEKQISKLKAQEQTLLASRGKAAKAILKQMKQVGVTIEDLQLLIGPVGASRTPKTESAPSASSANGKLPAKYRDPATGATWSGHARPPAWIKDAKDRSVYLIGKSTAKAKATTAVKPQTAKASNVAKPKYQDPVSGATWSGAGRPPAWIANAEDRGAFLVGALKDNVAKTTKKSAAKSVAKKTAAKAPAKKAPVGKKVATKKAPARATTATAPALEAEAVAA